MFAGICENVIKDIRIKINIDNRFFIVFYLKILISPLFVNKSIG